MGFFERALSVRPDSPACVMERVIVSTIDSEHLDVGNGGEDGFEEACLVEHMNRTIKDAVVKRYHYDDHDQLARHLTDFFSAYNFDRRLKTLKGLTAYEVLQMLDIRGRTIHVEYDPLNAETEHLARRNACWLDLAG